MKTIEEQRTELVALCNDLKVQLNLIVGHVDGLLGGEGEHFDEKQKADISHLRDRCQKLLDLIEDCLGLMKLDKTELYERLRRRERAGIDKERLFAEFVFEFAHEAITPIIFIIEVSSPDLAEGWFGPLNDKQKEELDHIHMFGRKLLSIVTEFRHLKREELDSDR